MATDINDRTLGVGCELRYWDRDASNPQWVKIGRVRNIDPSGKSKEFEETTDLDATDRYITKKGTFIDPGNVTFTMEFNRTRYDNLNTIFESVNNYTFEIVAPDDENTAWEFEGLITELPLPSMNPKEVMKMDITIEISGKPETGSGSGSA